MLRVKLSKNGGGHSKWKLSWKSWAQWSTPTQIDLELLRTLWWVRKGNWGWGGVPTPLASEWFHSCLVLLPGKAWRWAHLAMLRSMAAEKAGLAAESSFERAWPASMTNGGFVAVLKEGPFQFALRASPLSPIIIFSKEQNTHISFSLKITSLNGNRSPTCRVALIMSLMFALPKTNFIYIYIYVCVVWYKQGQS